MNCRLVRGYVDAYVDGELDPTQQIDVERHMSACAACQEQIAFARSFRRTVRATVGGEHAPPGLRERIVAAASAEAGHRSRDRMLELRYIVPVASAAAAVLFFTATHGSEDPSGGLAPRPRTQQAGVVPVLEDVVRLHSQELPADVHGNEPQAVSQFFRHRVDFPVRPAVFHGERATLQGARLSSVRDGSAAALYYEVRGRRVTVVVFAGESAVEGSQQVVLGGRPVSYQSVRGYTVPVVKQSGLTYAFTGDLDRDSLLQLAAHARLTD